jgi:hypothetical protein
MSRPLPGHFLYYLYASSHTCRIRSSICLRFLNQTVRMSPVHSFWLLASALIAVTLPLGTLVLISFYRMLFLSLILAFSHPYCGTPGPSFSSVFYSEQIFRYSRVLCSWNYSMQPQHIYHCLPMLRIYPGGSSVGLKYLLYGILKRSRKYKKL